MSSDGNVLYHNPRCSKSREAHALLQSRGVAFREVRYLDEPPSPAEIRTLLLQLALPARALLRTGEVAYAQLGLADNALDDEALIAAMHAHPELIERPVFVHSGRAVIGRPPERVLSLLKG